MIPSMKYELKETHLCPNFEKKEGKKEGGGGLGLLFL